MGEWLSFAANAVPRMLVTGKLETHRGPVAGGAAKHEAPSAQTPAVFDFSRRDEFVLEEEHASSNRKQQLSGR